MSTYPTDKYPCRDCGTVVELPLSFTPDYHRRVVDIAVHAEGESLWDRVTRHLCVCEPTDDFQDSVWFARCRVGKGAPNEGARLTLAMIQRELAAEREASR